MASEKALRTRASLLEAARMIVHNEGIDALTMDRVAEIAQVSKGACMYHFPTKRALIAALIENYVSHLREGLACHEALFSGEASETLVPGYVEWYKEFDADNHGWAEIGVNLLSRAALDPELLKPVRDWYKEVSDRIEKLPAERQVQKMLAVMALEGFFFAHKFGFDQMNLELKARAWKYLTEELAPSKAQRKPK